MNKLFAIVFLAAAGLSGTITASAQEASPPQGPPQGQRGGFGGGQGRFQLPPFAELDKNHDKKLSRDELPTTLPAQMFDRLDANRDGFIDEEEWRSRGRMGGGNRLGESLVKFLDANGDANVSPEEFAKIVTLFDILDRNHDGALSTDELNGLVRALGEAQMRATGGVNTNSAFDKMDKNKDGKITADETEERMFRALDLNKDGAVTREEFEKAVKQMAERSKAQSGQASSAAKKP